MGKEPTRAHPQHKAVFFVAIADRGAGYRGAPMPKLAILPHSELAATGVELSVPAGTSMCDALLDNGIDIEHACGKVGACTTCHVIVRSGFASLSAASEQEEDMLDRAWGVEQGSRLSCQALIADADLTIELPRYSVNHAKENG